MRDKIVIALLAITTLVLIYMHMTTQLALLAAVTSGVVALKRYRIDTSKYSLQSVSELFDWILYALVIVAMLAAIDSLLKAAGAAGLPNSWFGVLSPLISVTQSWMDAILLFLFARGAMSAKKSLLYSAMIIAASWWIADIVAISKIITLIVFVTLIAFLLLGWMRVTLLSTIALVLTILSGLYAALIVLSSTGVISIGLSPALLTTVALYAFTLNLATFMFHPDARLRETALQRASVVIGLVAVARLVLSEILVTSLLVVTLLIVALWVFATSFEYELQ